MKKTKQFIVLVYKEGRITKRRILLGGLWGEVRDVTPIDFLLPELQTPVFTHRNGRYEISFCASKDRALVFSNDCFMDRAIQLAKYQKRHTWKAIGGFDKIIFQKLNLNSLKGAAKNLKIDNFRTRKLFNDRTVVSSGISNPSDIALGCKGYAVNVAVDTVKDGWPLNSMGRQKSPRTLKMDLRECLGSYISMQVIAD